MKNEVVHVPITYEIHPDENGKPYLKTVERRRNNQVEGRGKWVSVGTNLDFNISRVVWINQKVGKLIVLPCDDGHFRALVLTD